MTPTGNTEDAAWLRFSVEREKATYQIANLMTCVLVPMWSVLDFLLEPGLIPTFLFVRVVVLAVTIVAWRFIARSNDLRANRLAMMAPLLAVGLQVVAMLPMVETYYPIYTFGFSLVFWGAGLLLIWPVRYAIAIYATLIAAHVVVYIAFDDRTSLGELAGSLFYLMSAAMISSVQVVVRRRLEDQAFRASYRLAEQNAELATTIEALDGARARLVASSALLAESLELETTARRVAEIAVPAVATWSVVRAHGTVGASHTDPARVPVLLAAAPGIPALDRTRFLAETTPAELADLGLAGIAARSVIAIPLGKSGVLVLGADRPFTTVELGFAEEVGLRAALALDNARLFREAELAIRTRDDFISIASHELRTPLTTLGLTVEAVAAGFAPDDPNAAKIAKLDRQVVRLTRLITQLLDVSQLATGRIALDRREGIRRARPARSRSGLPTTPPGSAALITSPVRRRAAAGSLADRQVLANLVGNANQYAAAGRSRSRSRRTPTASCCRCATRASASHPRTTHGSSSGSNVRSRTSTTRGSGSGCGSPG